MQKSLLFLSIISASILFSAAMLSQARGQCTPQFSISSPESLDMTKSFIWVHIGVANTGSCEGSTTVYPIIPEGWYKGDNFTTRTLQPGESENSSIKIMAGDGAISSIIRFLAEGAAASETKIIIGGIEPEDVPQATPEQNEAPPIAPATSPALISVPHENAQPPAESVQSQPESGPVTGLLTSNPPAQIAVFALLLFGAGYLVATIRGEGFRYRFKKRKA